tara:strand:+ start:442 stop:897 length:456 start_codon:yes stop_codon:yes gene_type:complete
MIHSLSITRVADTNAYAANDVISGSADPGEELKVSKFFSGRSSTLKIKKVQIFRDKKETNDPRFKLVLLNGSYTSEDNTALSLSDAENKSVVAVIDPISTFTGGDSIIHFTENMDIDIDSNNSDDLGVILVAQTDFTPVSAETFKIKIFSE